jgi:uncharacterized damage-inducible protein DinB
MLSGLSMNELLDYTDWERTKWLEWLRQRPRGILEIGAGPGGEGRFEKVGQLVRHIFSAERRYVERLSGQPLTDPDTIPADDLEALFQFGQRSRRELRELLELLPAEEGNVPAEFKLMNSSLTATPRKIVAHVLLHEVRHWAQIATLFRLSGQKVDLHDFLFSPVMGGAFGREPQNA